MFNRRFTNEAQENKDQGLSALCLPFKWPQIGGCGNQRESLHMCLLNNHTPSFGRLATNWGDVSRSPIILPLKNPKIGQCFPCFFSKKTTRSSAIQRRWVPGSWDARAITFHCWPAGPTANTRWTTGCRSSHDRNRVGGRSWRTASSPTQVAEKVENPNPYAPWCWYIYLQNWVIFGANVGKYSSTMEHMGNDMI